MPTRGRAYTVKYFAGSGTAPAAGDAGNHTLYVSKDAGAPAAATNSPAELGRGWYRLTLTAAEMTADNVLVEGTSSSFGVTLDGVQLDTARLPAAEPGAEGGLPVCDDAGGVALAAAEHRLLAELRAARLGRFDDPGGGPASFYDEDGTTVLFTCPSDGTANTFAGVIRA